LGLVLKKNDGSFNDASILLDALASINWRVEDQIYIEVDQVRIPLHPISGNTSRKRFYRVRFKGLDYVAVKFPENGPLSEEFFVDFGRKDLNQIEIFVNISEFLAKYVPFMPPLYGYMTQENVVLMSYLGQESLLTFMQQSPEKQRVGIIFRKLIEWLVSLQLVLSKETQSGSSIFRIPGVC
jgi:hypothetical protein